MRGNGLMDNILDYKVSKFKFTLCYYVHFQNNPFGKGMNSLIPTPIHPAMGSILSLLFFYKYSFSFKLIKKVDMPLYKETKP